MPAVPIIRTAWGHTRPDTMGVKVENEPVISMTTTPPQMRGTPGVWTIHTEERPGKTPISSAAAPGLRTASFDHWVQNPNPYGTVENLIVPLEQIAAKGKRVRFINGGHLVDGAWWWIESLDVEELEKGKGGVTSRAKLAWTLTEANTVDAVRLAKTGVKQGTLTVVKAA